ncbi:hypothetical protein GCM10011374_28610 [Kocuria dechangensis]|uniref:Uncharacterized protein n=1 Tax=Kocuria dechangensis TaxID=1176249 RepID=A0A917H147_9MICC|nr:hypothetical protein [Kocuria dechangensis]GGG63485.1 hypothetical protein GCM10011374_28610 [Kocuria dechangensis]
MNTTPASGDSIPDDPHLADDVGVPDTPARDLETAQDPLGQTNAGQRLPGVSDAGTPTHEVTGDDQDPAKGGYQPPTSD